MSHKNLDEDLKLLTDWYATLTDLTEGQREAVFKEVFLPNAQINFEVLAARADRKHEGSFIDFTAEGEKVNVSRVNVVPFQGYVAEKVVEPVSLEQLLEDLDNVDIEGSVAGIDVYPVRQAKDIVERLIADSKVPAHTLDPVMVQKQVRDTLNDLINCHTLFPDTLFCLTECVEQLNESIGKHVAEPVGVEMMGDSARILSRLEHTLDRMQAAVNAPHAVDISKRDLADAALFLKSIRYNNPGWENLGKEGHLIVPDAQNLPEEVLDSVRRMIMAYGNSQHSAEQIRLAATMSGDLGMTELPKWFATTWGHVSKGGFTSLIYHILTTLASKPVVQNRFYLSHNKLQEAEKALKAGDAQAIVRLIEECKGGKGE